ncbi:10025_t:CDS:2, partial [Scutellospora calospora]
SEDSLELESSLKPEGSLELESLVESEDSVKLEGSVEPKDVRSENLLELLENILFQKGKAYYSLEAFKYMANQYSEAKGFKLMRISPTGCEIPKDIKEEILLLKKAGIPTSQIQSLLVAHDFLLLLQQKCRNDPEFSFEFELDYKNSLNAYEEAEDISAYKKLKFSAEWNKKDMYMYEEIASENELHRFKLLCYEKSDTIHWQKDLPELELAKAYINFYNYSQTQALRTLALQGSSSESSTDPNKCVDFTLYLKEYLEALYINTDSSSNSTRIENMTASLQLPVINNLPKSKAVERSKKGRIRSQKENTSVAIVKKKHGQLKKAFEKSLTKNQSENNSLSCFRNIYRVCNKV